jgi:hypothetical protein
MAGGQGRRLVGEEQLRIAAGSVDLPPAAIELQPACNPAGVGMCPAGHLSGVVMEDAAIAHEGAARLDGL